MSEAIQKGADSKPKKPLGARLVDAGLISDSQLDLALREQKRSGGYLGETLVQLGFCTPEAITELLAQENEVEVVDVRRLELDVQLLELVSFETARRYKLIPVRREGDMLTVALADSFDVVAMDAVERESGLLVNVVTAPEAYILQAIERNYARTGSINDSLESVLSGDLAKAIEEGDETPMVRLVDQILQEAIKSGASDIHLHPEEKNLRVRTRVDGVLRQELLLPKTVQAAVTARLKLISGLDITEKRSPQDGRIRIPMGSSYTDLRVSTLPTNHGESVVMRILDSGAVSKDLDDLGFSPKDQERFESAIDRAFGMVLVTGPTGSGKTTTLYTALSCIDRETRSVFTLEDPIEYSLPLVRQTQVNPDVGMDFAAGLRSLLRQDPDVILVGEIRDQETAELATRAALTGHLVFSTLHTNSALGVIPRLVDMGVDRYLLPSALVGIVGQRLLRRLCPNCREQVPGVDAIFDEPALAHLRPDTETHWRGAGCGECSDTGYKGRMAAYEVLLIEDSFHDAILAGGSESEMADLARESGMTTMLEDGLVKANAGLTSVAEVLRVLR
ncbi:MAG: ATPase, T2SS/T4P/T4SS family [Pseudomonadaceae bacterium]|nr:ATPase, T2SS/T4P/T4SS family [Pseudomonadaceae bacterium]